MIDTVRDKPATDFAHNGRRDMAGAQPAARPSPRSVAIIVYDGVTLFEFGVVWEVFGGGNAPPGAPWYELSVCGRDRTTVVAEGGLQVRPSSGLDHMNRFDTVIVPPTGCLDD